MKLKNHYFEAVDFLENMLTTVFKDIEANYENHLETVNEQYPFERIQIANPAPRISFEEAVKMLSDAGVKQDLHEDLTTDNEKYLGRLVKEQMQSDFYIVYNYPKASRPFYTMPNPENPAMTNSYDFFLRGEEILSGAQRINNRDQLIQSARDSGIEIDDDADNSNETDQTQESKKQHKNANIVNYADSFKYGAPMHAGAGLGFERIVKLYLGLDNIRKVSIFPRDPKRLHP
jgi:aspartyl-tRNA synthetase